MTDVKTGKRFLQFVNWKTGERAEILGKVDVTGKSPREIERIEAEMLMSCDEESGWFVDEVRE